MPLAIVFIKGIGVAKNQTEAAKWYQKAAERDYKLAEENLGLYYKKGRCVQKDYVQAYKWWSLAASHGDETARKNLNRIERKMSKEQVGEAQKLVSDFKLRYSVASSAAPQR